MGLRQFLLRTKIIGLYTAKRIFSPRAIISYSQCGEDLQLARLIPINQDGFYVDVGSNDPIHRSNTYLFYIKGWKGIAIDGNPELIKRHKKMRPLDNAVCALVSEKEEEKTYFIFDDHCLSTISRTEAVKLSKTRKIRSQQAIKTIRLDRILREQHAPQKFEILSIDVEGYDLQVLRGINLEEYRPKIIAIEIHDFDQTHPNKDRIYAHLSNNQYTLHSYLNPTAFFVDARNHEMPSLMAQGLDKTTTNTMKHD
jgi:FkbM family methyltransferase